AANHPASGRKEFPARAGLTRLRASTDPAVQTGFTIESQSLASRLQEGGRGKLFCLPGVKWLRSRSGRIRVLPSRLWAGYDAGVENKPDKQDRRFRQGAANGRKSK